MNNKRLTAVLMALGITMICFSGCSLTEGNTAAPTAAPSPTAAASVTPKATVTPTPKATATPKPMNTGTQGSSGSQSGGSSSQGGSSTGGSSSQGGSSTGGSSSEGSETEEVRETLYISGNVTSNDGSTMSIETGSDGSYYEITFDISGADLDIQSDEITGGSGLRSSLNVDVEYYVEDGVNIATYVYSDGVEHFSPSQAYYQQEQAEQETSQEVDESMDYDNGDDYTNEDTASETEY